MGKDENLAALLANMMGIEVVETTGAYDADNGTYITLSDGGYIFVSNDPEWTPGEFDDEFNSIVSQIDMED